MFDNYRDKYENVTMKRENGILEVALHTRGGPLVFNGHVHAALVRAFRDIGDDAENHVVILTGTGNEFCAQITADGFDFFTPTGYDKILREGTKVLENILDIQVPMIAAINGPFTVHSEYALLCDIVIATEDAYFEDAPHPAFGIVPGDGLHIVWPEVIGEIRGRYFLLSGQKLSAAEAKAYGAVCTPDFFGFNTRLELQYRGRLDASRKETATVGWAIIRPAFPYQSATRFLTRCVTTGW